MALRLRCGRNHTPLPCHARPTRATPQPPSPRPKIFRNEISFYNPPFDNWRFSLNRSQTPTELPTLPTRLLTARQAELFALLEIARNTPAPALDIRHVLKRRRPCSGTRNYTIPHSRCYHFPMSAAIRSDAAEYASRFQTSDLFYDCISSLI